MARSKWRLAVVAYCSSLALVGALAVGVSIAKDGESPCVGSVNEDGECGAVYHGRLLSVAEAARVQFQGRGMATLVTANGAVMFGTVAELDAFQAKRLAALKRGAQRRSVTGPATTP